MLAAFLLAVSVPAYAQQPPNCAVGGFVISPDQTIWVCRGTGQAPDQVSAGGSPGPTGPTGPQGDPGADGATGATGPQGDPGSNGSNGAQGPTGPTGNNGTNGTDGAQGPTGPTGPTGPAGGAASDTVLVLAGDVSTGANTTLVDLTGMAFTADAAGKYKIEIWGVMQSAAATTGYGIGINCAQTPVLVALTGSSQLANTGTVSAWSAIANNAIVGVTSGIPTGATNVPTHGGGVLIAHATSSGTCTFRLRSETTAVATMKANSLIVVRKVN